MDLVSIVIVTSGREEYLKSCLKSIDLQNIKNFKRGKPIHSEIWSLLIFQIWFYSYH